MKKLGPFQRISEPVQIKIYLKTLKEGINSVKDHIIKVDEFGEIIYVVSKTCDHAGGKLIVKGNSAICPLHGWQLNLDTLRYNDSHKGKEEIEFTIEDDMLIIESSTEKLYNPYNTTCTDEQFSMQWLNHACVNFKFKGISLTTDPWLYGPAFLGGWWLNEPSLKSSILTLTQSDFIYISHNHPDHLHPETLKLVSKDKTILSPKFTSGATTKYLRSLGFTNIKELEFNQLYELQQDLVVGILKSGDFRDDSGLYIQFGNQQCLLTEDSNYLNSGVLPSNIDVLLTAFAGGASGFPMIYDNYSESDKNKILRRNANAVKAAVLDYINKTRPKFYHPYAGMFKEKALRDLYIKNTNLKNSANSYSQICSSQNVEFLNPDKRNIYCFSKGELKITSDNNEFLETEPINIYLESFSQQNTLDLVEIVDYMSNSQFFSEQILNLVPTNDEFEASEKFVFCDFSKQEFSIKSIDKLKDINNAKRTMTIKIRSEILMMVVTNKMPWEDFTIGFQARISRFPNTYESEFWYHFTNVYINDQYFKFNQYCGACKLIEQNTSLI